jgi:hypothetical protein
VTTAALQERKIRLIASAEVFDVSGLGRAELVARVHVSWLLGQVSRY